MDSDAGDSLAKDGEADGIGSSGCKRRVKIQKGSPFPRFESNFYSFSSNHAIQSGSSESIGMSEGTVIRLRPAN